MKLIQHDIYRDDIRRVINNVYGIERLHGASVLVTGASGMLGSFLVDTFRIMNEVYDAGIHIYAASRDVGRMQDRFGVRPDLVFLSYDLMKPVEFDVKADYVLHAAGNSDPASFNTDPVGTISGNVIGTCRLLEYAVSHGCTRFLYVSSGEVYGKAEDDVESYDETFSGYVDPISVRSCYPSSKRTAETLCVSYGIQYGLESVIVRPSHIYGPGFKADDSHAYVQFLHDALAGRDIVMKSAGTQMRSYVYVADCVAGILTALIKGEIGQAYNVANANSVVSIAQLAQAIADAAGMKVVIDVPNEKDIRDKSPISRQVLKTDKLVSLGYRPFYGIKEGIVHTYEILKDIVI